MMRRPAMRVLVGDDHEDSASSLGFVLEACGFEVRTALDGQAALETAVRYRPDAIILDIGLPTLDGYEICRRIRAQRSWGADVLILALTGRGTDDDKRLSREAGFDLHIVKPARPERLMALLETRQRALLGKETVRRSTGPDARPPALQEAPHGDDRGGRAANRSFSIRRHEL